ncbi:MAG: 23S rRNA (uracil(1939)-C(5))-methyltransferase RlmD [Firmicutes bacterium]|nr:23S rRNA (uracil(1939)-C(5))-methyltransferase RlmD [Bacillota bacterium]
MEKEIKIQGMDNNGRGIAFVNNKITFIPYTLEGEIVDIEFTIQKKKYQEAKALHITNCNENRVKPICPYYGTCGGCNLMHLTYQEQLNYKKKKGIDLLKKFAHLDMKDVPILSSIPFSYRNKVTLHVKDGKIGFYEAGSHQLVEIEHCDLLPEKMNEIIMRLKKVDTINSVSKIMIRSFQDGLETQVLFYPQEKLNEEEVIHSIKDLVTSIYIDDTCIYGKVWIQEQVGTLTYQVAPSSFFQVNTKGMKLLYDEIKKGLDPKKTDCVLDLYCGAGTIGIYIAKHVKHVYGVELNQAAIESAKVNKEINGLNNIDFYEGDTKKVLGKQKLSVNKVIVDPPRSGLDEKTRKELLELSPERFIYVSCNPVTLARDINEFKEKYQVLSTVFVDMFPNTDDVETVMTFVRK